MGSAAMIGPILGGGLIALNLFGSGWRLVFLINLPLGSAGAGRRGHRSCPRSRARHAHRLDLGGAVLAGVAALAIVYPADPGPRARLAGLDLRLDRRAVSRCSACFALHLRRRRRAGLDPLIEPSIFPHRGYSAGALVLLLYFGGMVGSMLAITLFLQLGEGFSAIHAGLDAGPVRARDRDHRAGGGPAHAADGGPRPDPVRSA